MTEQKKDKDNSDKNNPDIVFDNLSKTFGKDFAVNASELETKEVISTGYREVDEITGTGGIPRGIVVELFGPEASGKGVLSMHICASAQKDGLRAVWIDAEHQANKPWMIINGIDVDKMKVISPLLQSAEQVLQAMEDIIVAGAAQIIVVDSLAALIPKAEIDKPMGEGQIGIMGAIMSKSLRKLTTLASKYKCTIIFINQIRDKIGVLYGSPETTPGGKSLGHYSSLRIRMQKTSDKIEKNNEQIGIQSKVKIVKNRFGMPGREAIMPIYYEEYNPKPLDILLDLARKCLVIRMRKGTYYYDKIAGETINDVLIAIHSNGRIPEFAEEFEKYAIKKEVSYSDIPEIVELLNIMKKNEFSIGAINE